MMSLEDRRDEFEAMPNTELLRLLLRANPFGGYSIGARRGQLSRNQAIDTLLRFEGYVTPKPAERSTNAH